MTQDPNAIFTDEQWEMILNRLELPNRQRQVVRHLFEGRSDKQIAQAIGIALPTVRSHLRRIYSRFDVQDRTELVLYIVRQYMRINGDERDVMHPDGH